MALPVTWFGQVFLNPPYGLCLTHHRIKCIAGQPGQKDKGVTQGGAFVYFGSQPQRFTEISHQFGRVVLPDIEGEVTMRDIHAAFEGRMGSAAELRTTKKEKSWAPFSLTVNTSEEDDTATTWVRVAYHGTDAEALAGKLIRGTEAYIEGSLKLDTWTAKDGAERSDLSVVAWTVQPLGQIGRKRPEAPHKQRLVARHEPGDAIPF